MEDKITIDINKKKERCFADRKDGTCHALIEKNCKGCRFYCPRSEVYHNPFYEYSYETKYAFESGLRLHKVKEEFVMRKGD